ncbi:MAG TPA: HDOD domain-containing protein [Nautiliaceae bacterium]|nr:HDOD domain-containing protein [Nautiliaceae bacterium]
MNEKIIEQIKALPPLPKSIVEVQKIINNPNSSIADLIKVIKEDPMLTANLLKVANSPLYGFRGKIKTIAQVVSLLGMVTIKGFVISFVIKNSLKFDLSAYGVGEKEFHDVSSKRNMIALEWFKNDKGSLDIIAPNSFLIDLGAVVISLILNNEGKSEVFKKRLLKGENREKLEREFVGAVTTEVTAEMFKHWNFSKDLIESMKNVENPKGRYQKESASLLTLKTLVDLLKPKELQEEKAFKIARRYSLDINSLKDAIKKIKEKENN